MVTVTSDANLRSLFLRFLDRARLKYLLLVVVLSDSCGTVSGKLRNKYILQSNSIGAKLARLSLQLDGEKAELSFLYPSGLRFTICST